MTKPIVVGVDGSDSALRAVRWATEEAASRNAPVKLVHACLLVAAYTPTLPSSADDVLADEGREWLREASRAAADVALQVDVTLALERGDPAMVLVEASGKAQLMVLGSRGLGGFTGLVIGSVASKLAQRGACPLVVVRGEDMDRAGKPVVVGVDGSPASEAAIVFAYEQAARLHAPLVAVHTWSDTVPAATLAIDWQEIQTVESEVLSERLAGWQEKYPEVCVERVVTWDRPARSLIEQARDAQLVVVGSRGRGGFAGLLLGSTSQALVHHAPCPVAVVRPD